MIHEEICTIEVAKLAKEKGFNMPTAEFYNEDGDIGCYPRAFPHNEFPDGDYAAPTQALLQRWLREEKGVIVESASFPNKERKFVFDWVVFWNPLAEADCDAYSRGENYPTYQLALEDGLKYALENLV